jgi:hypothetical protein
VEREKAVITDPDVAKAVADIVREQGARAVIAESSAVGVDTAKVIEASGYKTLRDQGYEVVDLKKTKIVKVPFKDGKVLKEVETYELVQQADVIVSLPKMKTHDQADMTGPMKNLKGLLSDKYKRLLHQEYGVFEGCVDITAFLNLHSRLWMPFSAKRAWADMENPSKWISFWRERHGWLLNQSVERSRGLNLENCPFLNTGLSAGG